MRNGRNIALRFFALKKIRYVVAVITFLFVVFMGIVIKNFIALTPEKLFNEAYVPFVVSTIHGSYQKPTDSLEINYEKGNYKSIARLGKHKRNFTDEENFLMGLSSMQLHDYTKAIAQLREVTTHPNSFLKDAQFYLGLVYLLNQDFDNSIEILDSIYHDKTHPYQQRFSKSFIRRVKLLKWK